MAGADPGGRCPTAERRVADRRVRLGLGIKNQMALVFDYLSAPLKKYITSTIQFYLSKYIDGISLEGFGLLGDIVLQNLELRRDVLQVLE